jgi:hypothetical protein
LALVMDLLTDAICLGGQYPIHAVTAARARTPRDLERLLDQLGECKTLVQSVFLDLTAND